MEKIKDYIFLIFMLKVKMKIYNFLYYYLKVPLCIVSHVNLPLPISDLLKYDLYLFIYMTLPIISPVTVGIGMYM